MKTDFEKQLERQPLRELPREWRSQILNAASRAGNSTLVEWFSTWLWPHPRAWAGLAAAWVVIFLLHFTAPDEPRVAGNGSPMTFQSFARMQQQNLMMAQLLGSLDSGDQPAAPPPPPKPRSEGPRQQLIG
jgi:hypothetical protein